MKTSRHGHAAAAGLLAPVARIARAWSAWRARPGHARPAPLVEELEARLLYSADPAGVGLALAGAVVEQRLVDVSGAFIEPATVAHQGRELLIVAAGIADSRTLLDGLARDGRAIDVLELDPAQDSLDQISAALAGRHDLTAIHVLSHGASGALQLGAGGDTLDAATLAARGAEIGRWGDALQAGGDILLYGCDVAAGDAGAAFVRQLSALMGADVAASDNLTGDRALHGDWTLEFSTGRIDSAAAFTAEAQAQWHGALEIPVNSVTRDKQHQAAVAVAPTGSFVVTWTADKDQDGNNTGVFARRFDATGTPLGGEIQVNTAFNDRQETPTVGIAADGSFVVAWASRSQKDGDTDGWSVRAQRFTDQGQKAGEEFLVNQTTAKDQWQPSISVAADGQFVIAWTNSTANDIFVRHYDKSGNPLRGEVLASGVNGAGSQTVPSVAIAADGSYVVAWQSDSGGTAKSIYAQRFNADDTLRGTGFRVNTYDADDQTQPSVAMSGAGAFLIAWTSAKQDGDGNGVYAQRYGTDGVRAGGEFRVNTTTAKDQKGATAAMDAGGNFVIAWTSAGEDNGAGTGVYAQRYSADGAALGGVFLVNSTTAGNQAAPAAAMNGGGTLVVGWEGAGLGDGDGVFAALYNASNAPPGASPDALSLPQGGQADTSAAAGVLANDLDPDSTGMLVVDAVLSPVDGSVLAVTAGGVSVAGIYGTLLIRSDGSYVYTADTDAARALAAEKPGIDVFTYIIRDNDNANASSTLTVTVTGVNDAPAAGNDNYAVERTGRLDVPAAGVLANDTDVDRNPADRLTVVSVNGATASVGASLPTTYGTLRLDADGTLSYVPNALNTALQSLLALGPVVETFSYEVSDGTSTSSATIRITILGKNFAPVANDDSGANYTLQQGGSLAVGAATGVLKNDTDPDGTALTAHLVSGPLHGVLGFNADGSFVYTPDANYYGTDSFRYRASDGSLDSTDATVTLTIMHVNHAPLAADDHATVTASGNVAFTAAQGMLANDSDRDAADLLSVTSIQYGDQVIPLAPGATAILVTEYGRLSVDSDGGFRYVANGAASMRLGQGAVSGDSFSYTVADGNGGTATASISIDIAGVNDAPAIGIRTSAAQAVSDQGSLQPFAGITIADVDSPAQQLVVRIALDDPAKGRLVASQGGSYDAATGIYTFSGSAADATAAVSALVFVPASNRLAPGSTETTRFTITADDGLTVTSDGSVTVAATSVNDAPAIAGTATGQAIDDTGSINPFADVTIADDDSPAQQLTVRVALDDPARGSLSGANGSYDATAGVYTLSGTATQVTGALRALVFTPTANRVAPGLAETTLLTLTASDGVTTTSAAAISVVATSVNDAPSISGVAAGQRIDDKGSLNPFAGAVVSDVDSPAQPLTVRVTLDDPARGTLSGAGGRYDPASGVYLFTGTAAEAGQALRALVFNPAANRVAPGASETALLTLSVDDGRAVARAATRITVLSVNDAPVLDLPAGVQTINDKDSLAPFAGITVADPDSPSQQLTLRITLDDPARGRLSAAAGSYDASAGVYVLTGTAAQLNAAARAMLFTPEENRVAPGQSETATFSISVSDGMLDAGGAMSVASLSVNDAPVALAVSARGMQDGAALALVLAASDADGDALALVIGAAPAHGALYRDAAGLSPLLPGARLPLNGGATRIYFIPEAGWNGDTGFSYAPVDKQGLAGASAAVSITITPALRTAAQTTAAPAVDTPARAAAPVVERSEEPAAAAAPASTQLASVSVAAPARQPEPGSPLPETVLPSQSNPQSNPPPTPVATSPRGSADRISPAAAALLAAADAPDAGSEALFSSDLGAASALAEGRIERASAATRSETLARSLDEMREDVKAAEEAEHRIVGSSVAVGAGFSVGYVIWLLRGGVLATSLLSSLPAWRFVDPLPVLARMRTDADDDDDTDDSLESLVAGDDRRHAGQRPTTGTDR
ncbi:tandem-95 repeat protein [Noviherbaspirillum suwonense]|uniref:VCBS repeat-containing protein n=1 Tax=Noviherbaspirillum suwonense TaxID=1224511 RepID=A0ABY1QP85_9BURK|nr:Ig-like domain-containing protein [Noviherbaspirillum suwonense]SMP76920.1 VCBS repeat-containing protein [Noviherbaspirillum suwonense]